MRGGYPAKPDAPHSHMYSRDGDLLHDDVRFLLRDAGVELDWLIFNDDRTVTETMSFKKEYEIDGKPFVISGRCDGKIKVNDEWMPLEIKTLNGFKYKYVNLAYNKGEILDYLYNKCHNYLVQTMLCADSLGFDRSYLLIKDRSSCQFGFHDETNDYREGIIIENDKELLDKVYTKMNRIGHALNTGVLPPQDFLEKSKECGWCPYQKTCWGK